jgi:hypothetical protein
VDDSIVWAEFVGFCSSFFGSGDGVEVSDDYTFGIGYGTLSLLRSIGIPGVQEDFVALVCKEFGSWIWLVIISDQVSGEIVHTGLSDPV